MINWPIKEYNINEVVYFQKTREEYGELSNFALGFPIIINGNSFETSEALYQACKFPDNPEVQLDIVRADGPYEVKKIAKSKSYLIRGDWDFIKDYVMVWVCGLKVFQNSAIFNPLINNTSGREFVEISKFDDYWGAVLRKEDLRYVGRNVLGNIYTNFKKILPLTEVKPPLIANFLMLGDLVSLQEFNNGELKEYTSDFYYSSMLFVVTYNKKEIFLRKTFGECLDILNNFKALRPADEDEGGREFVIPKGLWDIKDRC